ncbi:MAG: endo-1,4-beta-xylanase [Armatimonadota bacterium]|nr:endo-1,4-beta-xylanase [bacterium]MCS7309137.1 endo-1,4-beta-xylanase [Armatimonadota bacterium]MDW8104910.1 endo-1,4-beta-xylanase [Armatimonadota bacterium]MDW8291324.1 endo-1,4-beta-xylanase [Armatimonadota bacterium]
MNAQELLATADSRIEKIRKADVTVKVLDRQGKPVAGAQVEVQQTRHAFLFGCNIFPLFNYQGEQHERYGKLFADLLNYATLAFYWGAYEPERGRKGREEQERIARWCQQRGIATKGHPLVWHEVYPRWAPNGADEVKPLLRDRVREIVAQFKGLIDRWDVVNEATVSARFNNGVGNWVKRDGAAAVVAECLAWAREANPQAILLYNDFNISPDFERLVEELIRRRAPFDAVGIQSHMHRGEWSLEQAWQVCETYARFGKPLHFTETTVLSGEYGWERPRPWPTTPDGEARQADYVEKFYTLLFSHPAVEAITWWDFMDGGWMGAPAGLVRADLSPKPVYHRLMRLVKGKWWTQASVRTNARGEASLRAFLGDYQVSTSAPAGKRTQRFTLQRGRNEWVIRLGGR